VLKFVPPIYHINVRETGEVSLAITFHYWHPITTVHQVLLELISLLKTPDPSLALRQDALDLYLADRAAFENYAREFTRRNATLGRADS
jgi:ubiquitin-protein ligase